MLRLVMPSRLATPTCCPDEEDTLRGSVLAPPGL